MSDHFVKRPKDIEPQVLPESWVVAYTRCLPLYGTVVKSLSETQPGFGAASGPVDVHLYLDGRAQVPAFFAGDGSALGRRLVGALDGDVLVVIEGRGDGAGLTAPGRDGCSLRVRSAACAGGLSAQPATGASMAAATAIRNAGRHKARCCHGDMGVSPLSRRMSRTGRRQDCCRWKRAACFAADRRRLINSPVTAPVAMSTPAPASHMTPIPAMDAVARGATPTAGGIADVAEIAEVGGETDDLAGVAEAGLAEAEPGFCGVADSAVVGEAVAGREVVVRDPAETPTVMLESPLL
jgi:hypothetical protein